MTHSESKLTRFVSELIVLLTIVLTPSWLIAQDQQGQDSADGIAGFWTLNLESREPAWLLAKRDGDQLLVNMRVYIGSDGPYRATELGDGRITFPIKPKRGSGKRKLATKREVEVGVSHDGRLEGVIIESPSDGSPEIRVPFTGKRVPEPPKNRPDLSQVRFGHPVLLFNGKDLSGWRPHEADKINGWKVKDGMLINSTPKTDFSATGDHANLRTKDEFEDFWLHIEFLIDKDRNSGIYLRGMYEAQVVDRDSRMQGKQGIGAIFGLIAPTVQAARPPGQWQTYDLTLVDRHITVVLNGVKVIDNQRLEKPTAGAIYTDPSAPGPIYLQGDHTSVKYRNIYLAPVIRSLDVRR